MSREPAALIILAGGEAKRMGFPKHQLCVNGKRVLNELHDRLSHLFIETIVVGRDLDNSPPGARIAEDLFAVRSPLVGIHAGLTEAATDLAFVVACDMPCVKPSLVEHLLTCSKGADVVVPVVSSYYEPLCAVYRRTCLRPVGRSIEQGDLKIISFYRKVRVREIHEQAIREFDPGLRSFVNINTPQEQRLAGSFAVANSDSGDL